MNEFYEQVFTIKQDIVHRTIAGEVFLVPIRGRLADMQQIFSLNPVAEHIWKHLDGKRKLGDIRDSVLSSFDVRREEAESDIREFIEDLLSAELIIGENA